MVIRREALAAALAATTADDTRYFLDAVQIDPAKRCAVATNGHVLLVATDKNPIADADFPAVPGADYHGDPAAPVLVPADTCRALIGTMPKKPTIAVLATAQLSMNGSPTTVTIAATDLQAPRVATIDTAAATHTFPQYERVMPSADRQGVKVTLAVPVLQALIKAAQTVKPTGTRGRDTRLSTVTFHVPTNARDLDDNSVISALGITIDGDDVKVTGAAMPCRL